MNSQQIRDGTDHEICEKLSKKLIENLGKEVIELIKMYTNIPEEQARKLVEVGRHLHYYDYCRVYSEKLKGVLDPFVVLETITALTLNLPKCIHRYIQYIRERIRLSLNISLNIQIQESKKLELAYSISQNAVRKLFEDNEVREAVKQGVSKLIEYLGGLDNCIEFKRSGYSSIIVESADLISFYRSSGSLMVFSDVKGKFVEKKLGCPLPSWVKGYLRLLLHKLVFVYALKEVIEGGQVDLVDLFTLYVYLLSRDDEDVVVEVSRYGVKVFNLVGVLMGCGSFASLLRVHWVAGGSGCSCVYRLGVERERVPFAVSLVQQHLHDFLEKLGVKVEDVVVMLEYFDDVVAVLASYASSALNDRGYRFLPFTASYPRVHSQLPSQYVFSKTRASEADVRRHLKVFIDLLRSYALYLINTIERCRQ